MDTHIKGKTNGIPSERAVSVAVAIVAAMCLLLEEAMIPKYLQQ